MINSYSWLMKLLLDQRSLSDRILFCKTKLLFKVVYRRSFFSVYLFDHLISRLISQLRQLLNGEHELYLLSYNYSRQWRSDGRTVLAFPTDARRSRDPCQIRQRLTTKRKTKRMKALFISVTFCLFWLTEWARSGALASNGL